MPLFLKSQIWFPLGVAGHFVPEFGFSPTPQHRSRGTGTFTALFRLFYLFLAISFCQRESLAPVFNCSSIARLFRADRFFAGAGHVLVSSTFFPLLQDFKAQFPSARPPRFCVTSICRMSPRSVILFLFFRRFLGCSRSNVRREASRTCRLPTGSS